ncbi:MAG: hypothetical protein IT427_06980 [Pirellulales bacterium]|nr:hypothetical protein [Pirellulales bacterium]
MLYDYRARYYHPTLSRFVGSGPEAARAADLGHVTTTGSVHLASGHFPKR